MTQRFFKPLSELTFSDSFMFEKIMQNPRICAGVIERLLHIKVGRIEYPELEKAINPFYSQQGIRFDVYVANSERVFDVEIQNYKMKDLPKRCRYYQSMLDSDSIAKGSHYSDLKESYILFLCNYDPFDAGLPVYTFDKICLEDKSIELGDKSHCIIYNYKQSAKEADPELRALLNYLSTNSVESEFTEEVNKMVEEGRFEQSFINQYMAFKLHDSDVADVAKEEGYKLGVEEGIERGIERVARKMLMNGYTIHDVSESTGLTAEQIQHLTTISKKI